VGWETKLQKLWCLWLLDGFSYIYWITNPPIMHIPGGGLLLMLSLAKCLVSTKNICLAKLPCNPPYLDHCPNFEIATLDYL
jgi:hypothetical protein